MKRISYLLALSLLMSLAFFGSCVDENLYKTEEELTLEELTSKPFTINSITEDGVEVLEEGQIITFSIQETGNFSIEGGHLPDPAPKGSSMPGSGTWAANPDSFDEVVLTGAGSGAGSGNEVSVILKILTMENKKLSFQYEGAGPTADDPTTSIIVKAAQ